MTENYKDFLDWATPQLTVDQYQTLCKILYSFKKYKETDEPGVLNVCKFKDDGDGVYTCGHFSHFFDEMARLAGLPIGDFFEAWYNDNVIFWPYKETPDLAESKERLISKIENAKNHTQKFLYVLREDKDGGIHILSIINKTYAGSALHNKSLTSWIEFLWSSLMREKYGKETHANYAREHNTKKILKHCLGFSNKQYKELVDKYPRKPNPGFSSYQVSVYNYFVKVYNQLIDIPIDTLYLPYLYYKYVSDEHGINPEGSTFISDIIIGIAELKERGELK
jgi:hypothetical protein|nr:MAG TPA: hypothetical protein [Caudoviricetes sp.]